MVRWMERTMNSNLEDAQAAVELHRSKNPLHNPHVATKPIVEYLIHTDKYMIRYRQTSAAEDRIRIHSVNGHTIASDKCAYICQLCGAIYQSKEYPNHSFFPTTDPNCLLETHQNYDMICGLQNVEKICLCPTIFEESEQYEEQLTKTKSIEWWNTHPNECHVCHKPFFNQGHVYETFNFDSLGLGKLPYEKQSKIMNRQTRYWHLFTDYDDDEGAKVAKRLVCEDCYYTSPEYKDVGKGPLAIKRYLARKKRRTSRK